MSITGGLNKIMEGMTTFINVFKYVGSGSMGLMNVIGGVLYAGTAYAATQAAQYWVDYAPLVLDAKQRGMALMDETGAIISDSWLFGAVADSLEAQMIIFMNWCEKVVPLGFLFGIVTSIIILRIVVSFSKWLWSMMRKTIIR